MRSSATAARARQREIDRGVWVAGAGRDAAVVVAVVPFGNEAGWRQPLFACAVDEANGQDAAQRVFANRPEEVVPALEAAFTTHKDELVFLDIQVDPRENVYPMIQGGKGLTEMILGSEEL